MKNAMACWMQGRCWGGPLVARPRGDALLTCLCWFIAYFKRPSFRNLHSSRNLRKRSAASYVAATDDTGYNTANNKHCHASSPPSRRRFASGHAPPASDSHEALSNTQRSLMAQFSQPGLAGVGRSNARGRSGRRVSSFSSLTSGLVLGGGDEHPVQWVEKPVAQRRRVGIWGAGWVPPHTPRVPAGTHMLLHQAVVDLA